MDVRYAHAIMLSVSALSWFSVLTAAEVAFTTCSLTARSTKLVVRFDSVGEELLMFWAEETARRAVLSKRSIDFERADTLLTSMLREVGY